MELLLPYALDLRITCNCNLSCDFCFGPKNKPDSKIEKWCLFLDKAKKYGVNNLVLTGGEPTLYPHFEKLTAYAKNQGYCIVLSTNGINLNSVYQLKHIDVLSIPIDGEDHFVCKEMRGIDRNNYNSILDLAKRYKIKYPEKKLKVGTVVSNRNINGIEGVFYSIDGIADVWKLYQVTEHPNNKCVFRNDLEIQDDIFDLLFEHLLNKYGQRIKIVAYRNRERNGKYLFCDPNGDAIVVIGDTEVCIGNFFNNFNNVLNEWKKYVDLSVLKDNFIETYSF